MSGAPSSCYYVDLLTIKSFFRRGSGRIALTAFVELGFVKEMGVRCHFTPQACITRHKGVALFRSSRKTTPGGLWSRKSRD